MSPSSWKKVAVARTDTADAGSTRTSSWYREPRVLWNESTLVTRKFAQNVVIKEFIISYVILGSLMLMLMTLCSLSDHLPENMEAKYDDCSR